MAKNVEDLNKTACLYRAAARRPGCPGAQPARRRGESEKEASLGSFTPESVLQGVLGATVLCPATLGSFWFQGTQMLSDFWQIPTTNVFTLVQQASPALER